VIAGKRINEGEQINILYGGGKLNNDRLIQDYGFIQAQNEFDKKQLTSPKSSEPIPGLPFAGMGLDDKEELTKVIQPIQCRSTSSSCCSSLTTI
jgi:hypothetical protein